MVRGFSAKLCLLTALASAVSTCQGERLFRVDARAVRCSDVTVPFELHDEIVDTNKDPNLYGVVFFDDDLTSQKTSTYYFVDAPSVEFTGDNGQDLYAWSGDNLIVGGKVVSFKIIDYGARIDGNTSTTIGWVNLTLPQEPELTSFNQSKFGNMIDYGIEQRLDVFSWTDEKKHGSCDVQIQLRASICEEGEYVDEVQSPCQTCSAGSRCNGRSSTLCSAGTYSLDRAPECKRCDAGYTCASSGSSNPKTDQCAAGTYSNAGDSTCKECFQGRYGEGDLAAINILCDGECSAGYYCEQGSTSSKSKQCPAGHWSAAGAGECNKCKAGFFGAGVQEAATAECDGMCDAGFYCDQGATSSTSVQCLAGHWSAPGSTECKKCKAGYYGAGAQAAVTEECDGLCSGGFYCMQGSTTSKANECPAGYWSLPGSTECSKCKDGYLGVAGGEYTDDSCAGEPPVDVGPIAAGAGVGLFALLCGILFYARRRIKKVRTKENIVREREAAVLAKEQELQAKVRDIQVRERSVAIEVDSLKEEKARIENESAETVNELRAALKAELEQVDPQAAERLDKLEQEEQQELKAELVRGVDEQRSKFSSKLSPEQLHDDEEIEQALRDGNLDFLSRPPQQRMRLQGDSESHDGDVDKLRRFVAEIGDLEAKSQYLGCIDELVAVGSLKESATSQVENFKLQYDQAIWGLKCVLHKKRQAQAEKFADRRKRRLDLVLEDAAAAQASAIVLDEQEDSREDEAQQEEIAQVLEDLDTQAEEVVSTHRNQQETIKLRLDERKLRAGGAPVMRRKRPNLEKAQISASLDKLIQDEIDQDIQAEIDKIKAGVPTKEELDSALQRLNSEKSRRKAEQLERIAHRRAEIIERRANSKALEEEREKIVAKQQALGREFNDIFTKMSDADERVKALKTEHEAATRQLNDTLEEKKKRQRERLQQRKRKAMQDKNKASKVAPEPKNESAFEK